MLETSALLALAAAVVAAYVAALVLSQTPVKVGFGQECAQRQVRWLGRLLERAELEGWDEQMIASLEAELAVARRESAEVG